MKGAARGLQLLGAALNWPARALLEEAAQLLWAMDIVCEVWDDDLLLVPSDLRRGGLRSADCAKDLQ